MICRRIGREILLVSQHDHSKLSGDLAQKIGNTLFTPPSPFIPVVEAIANHDSGWADADLHPELSPQRLPCHVFEVDVLTAISAWEKSVEQAFARDLYTALLVSLHTMALSAHVASRQSEPTDEFARQRVFRVRRFMHQQIELQERLRGRLLMRTDLPLRGGLAEEGRSAEEDLLRANFFLLELLDQVSLNLCFGRLVFQRIEMLYPRPGEQSISARIAGDAESGMTLSPWPFNAEKMELEIPARKIPAGPYRDAESLRAAVESAVSTSLRVVLRPAGS